MKVRQQRCGVSGALTHGWWAWKQQDCGNLAGSTTALHTWLWLNCAPPPPVQT